MVSKVCIALSLMVHSFSSLPNGNHTVDAEFSDFAIYCDVSTNDVEVAYDCNIEIYDQLTPWFNGKDSQTLAKFALNSNWVKTFRFVYPK